MFLAPFTSASIEPCSGQNTVSRRGRAHLAPHKLLIEYVNVQRRANHAHSVWRDPESDFGHDVLAAHRAAHRAAHHG